MMKVREYDNKAMNTFPIIAHTVGLNRPQEPRIRPHGMNLHQVFLICNGIGTVGIGEKNYTVQKGDLVFLKAHEPHYYKGADKSFATGWIAFEGKGCDFLFSYYNINNSRFFSNKDSGEFENALQSLHQIFDFAEKEATVCAKVYQSLITFFDVALKVKQAPIEKVYHYLQKKFSSNISLDNIFDIYPCSKSKLCYEFKEQYGCTIFEKLTEIRLVNAKLLHDADPRIKTSEIAIMCGFNDSSYFCRKFKEKYKKSIHSTDAPKNKQ